MTQKVVFFDIDGTLVDQDKNIPLSTEKAIQQLKDNGIYVVLATGRPPFMFEDIRRELDINTYISFSGQHVVLDGQTIYEHPFERDQIVQLYKAAQQNQLPMVFMSDVTMRATVKDHQYIKESLVEALKFNYPEVDVDFPMNEKVYQALLCCEEKKEDPLKEEHQGCHILRWHPLACDVMPSGGSKAIGVRKIMNAMEIDQAYSYAFGDGHNDIEMIREVGTGIAMGNAVDRLKGVADYITDHVDKDGVVKGLQAFNLI